QMDPAALPMVQTYREALNCEALRAEVFAGNKSPLIFGDPQEWVALMVQALELSAQGHHAEAASLRAQALEAAPAVDGTIDGQPFEWLADADSRLGPLLEAVINGRYYWIPFTHARQIRLDPPEDLRDVVWMPAYFTWSNGGETVGLIPTRYAGSEASEDGRVQLARITTWDEQPGDQFIGLGQRLLATDTGDHPIMDTREISFNLEAPPAQGDDGESSEAGDA
ncbi:MAG: type VI secretion system accessory protein TagJ, partial [Pseudomonadota bacterium]